MNENELKKKIEYAVNIFLHKEKFLLENDVNERSITHKLAIYIENEFKDYDVDCEYNRMTDETGNCDPKRVKTTIEKYIDERVKPEDIKPDDSKATTVYPDIIVHKRGNNNANLLVIEVKKSSNKKNNKKNNEKDIEKIKAYCRELEYENGLFLILPVKKDLDVSDFKMYDWYLKD